MSMMALRNLAGLHSRDIRCDPTWTLSLCMRSYFCCLGVPLLLLSLLSCHWRDVRLVAYEFMQAQAFVGGHYS